MGEQLERLRGGEYAYVTMRVDDTKTMIVMDDSGPAGATWADVKAYCRQHEQACCFIVFSNGSKCVFIDWVPADCPYSEDREMYSRNGEGLKEYVSREASLKIS